MTYTGIQKLPQAIKARVRQDCRGGEDVKLEFYTPVRTHDFVIVSCSFGIAWVAKVYEIIKGGPVALHFAVGNPAEGYSTTNQFSFVAVDPSTGNLEANFSTDFCDNQPEPIYKYHFQQESYHLARITSWNCELSKEVGTVWASENAKQ